MQDFQQSFSLAFELLTSFDSDLVEIIALSLRVSLTAVLLAALIAFPLGALLAVTEFRGKQLIELLINALMGLPPVVVGLIVYMLVSRSGPLGWMELLYTPTAMIIAQLILIVPIIAALSRQVIADLHVEYDELFRSLCLSRFQVMQALIRDARFSLVTVMLAGFGRAIAEVGAVILVGGNIDHLTRVMTTAIALETSKGNLSLALALGMVLLVIALLVNAGAGVVKNRNLIHRV